MSVLEMTSAFWSMLNRIDFDGIATAFRSAPASMGFSLSFARKMSAAPTPSTSRFSRTRASIFKRCDLPDPKKPETQTPFAVE